MFGGNKKKVECINCGETIDLIDGNPPEKDKFVCITTHMIGGEKVQEWFHFACWQLNFNNAVKKKFEAISVKAKEMMSGALQQLKNIQ